MKSIPQFCSVPFLRTLSLSIAVTAVQCIVSADLRAAQEGSAEPANRPQALTAADPEIDERSLELLVRHLTREELEIEADAWRDLLKEQIRQMTLLQLSDGGPPAPAGQDQTATTPPADRTTQLVEMEVDKVRRIKRLEIVLDSLEAKGGDASSWRDYVSAQQGLALSSTDTSTLLVSLKTWLTATEGGMRWVTNLLRFGLTLMVAWFGAGIASRLTRHAVSRVKGTSQLMIRFVSKFVRQVCLVVGIVIALAALEVDIAPLIAAIGAAGFVVGFALQDTLSNFASGLLILAYRPFDVGDVIEAAGISGVVDSVSLFSTHVRTFDNKIMIVPNNDIWGGTITNATASDTRRVDMVFGIGYDDDIEQAKSILERLLQSHALVLQEPAPVVQLNELGDSAVNFICRPWTRTPDYWTVYWDITRAVKQEFDEHGISIPYPQQDVHIHQHAAD